MTRVAKVDLLPGCDGDEDKVAVAMLAGLLRPGGGSQGDSEASDGVPPEGEASPPGLAVLSCGDFNVPSGLPADEDEGGSGPACHSVPLPASRQWQRRGVGALAPLGTPPGLELPGEEASPSPGVPEKLGVQGQRTPLSSKAYAYVPAARPERAAGAWGRSRAAPNGRPARAPTTVMMRNLPYCYTRQMLIDLLNSKGFSGEFDFLYLPIDFESGYHVGYAFVNLTLSEHAARFMSVFNKFNDWTPRRDNRICEVTWGSIQGFRANVERFEKKQLLAEGLPEKYKPVVFIDGVQTSFHNFAVTKQQLKGWDRKL